MTTSVKCIDVSAYQGSISVDTWKKIKDDIPCCIIRSSWTHQGSFKMEKDKHFDANIKAAYKAGMKIGVYHFSQATTAAEAKAEATFVVKTIKRYRKYITLPVVFDCEFGEVKGARFNSTVAKKLGKAGMLKVCEGFCEAVKAEGYEPMVYANLSMLNNYISATIGSKYKVWVAQYSKTCDYKRKYHMWQYTSGGKATGIKGVVDLSYIYDSNMAPETRKAYTGKYPTLPKRGYFKKGDKGENVRLLQYFLVWALGVTLKIDGDYGNMTCAAVMTFEEKQDLKVDGMFGDKCLTAAKGVRR